MLHIQVEGVECRTQAETWDDKDLYQLTSPAKGKFSEEEYGDQIISSSEECGYQLHFQNEQFFL